MKAQSKPEYVQAHYTCDGSNAIYSVQVDAHDEQDCAGFVAAIGRGEGKGWVCNWLSAGGIPVDDVFSLTNRNGVEMA